MKKLSIIIALLICLGSFAQQKAYSDSLTIFRRDYVFNHEVIKGADKKQMDFFPVNETYAVTARFEKIQQSAWFTMKTSGNEDQTFRPYGILYFNLHNKALKLHVYQSKDLMGTAEYGDYLFVPFTDSTNGTSTYENGRYIDMRQKDISNGTVLLDFNKAYNPYCAYIKGIYNCPVPPAENKLAVSIEAGEKKYKKAGD